LYETKILEKSIKRHTDFEVDMMGKISIFQLESTKTLFDKSLDHEQGLVDGKVFSIRNFAD